MHEVHQQAQARLPPLPPAATRSARPARGLARGGRSRPVEEVDGDHRAGGIHAGREADMAAASRPATTRPAHAAGQVRHDELQRTSWSALARSRGSRRGAVPAAAGNRPAAPSPRRQDQRHQGVGRQRNEQHGPGRPGVARGQVALDGDLVRTRRADIPGERGQHGAEHGRRGRRDRSRRRAGANAAANGRPPARRPAQGRADHHHGGDRRPARGSRSGSRR